MGIVERLRNHDLLTSDDTELAADMLEYFLNGPYKSGHYDYTQHTAIGTQHGPAGQELGTTMPLGPLPKRQCLMP